MTRSLRLTSVVSRALSVVVLGALASVAAVVPVTGAAAEGQAGSSPPETDAVLARVTDRERALPRVDHAPADAPRTDATRADAGDVIDIAFVYPAALAAQADVGGVEGLRAKFDKAIADLNQSFANSGVPVQARRVGDRVVAPPTTSNLHTLLDQLGRAGDGVLDAAQALREETHADLVSLWLGGSVPLGVSCGIGNLGGTQPRYDPEVSAFTVIYYTDCVDRFLVFAHEIGHNLSADHDPAAGSAPMSYSKPYARGLADPAHQFITVMAYYDACSRVGVSCTRLPYFSSPTGTTSQGHPTGSPQADNARAVAEQAPVVANYRQSQIYAAAPTITGTPNRGRSLTARTPGWAPGNVTFSYQWHADGVPLAGAVSPRLSLGKALVGRAVTVTVTGSAPHYSPVAATSAATPPIGKALFRRTRKPRIAGMPRVGRVLEVRMGSWKPSKGVRYRYSWSRNGKRIKGARGRTYRVVRKDRGKRIRVTVTGTRRGFEPARRTSRKVRIR